jgi:hypothetical protein
MGEKHGRSILLTKQLFHACKVLLHAVNLRHGTDFTFPPKEVVLRIFITLKNPSSLTRFETANLGSSGKHATTRPPRATRSLFEVQNQQDEISGSHGEYDDGCLLGRCAA